EERFRLILAASARGDEVERGRLLNAGQRLTLHFKDHFPFAQALHELSLLVFLELLEEAALYFDALESNDNAHDASAGDGEGESSEPFGPSGRREETCGGAPKGRAGKRPRPYCMLDLALAEGFML